MRTAAGDVARAGTLPDAALATGRMGATCGSCHQATRAGVRIPVVTTPEAGASTPSSRMRAHYWAADRMWEGLIGPSDEAWLAGARILADTAAWTASLATAARAADARVLAAQLQVLGRRALAASGQTDRAAIHGEALATCSGCHSLLNVQVE
jgi:cytochrome c553